MTKIATWNVNSIRVRMPRLLEWLEEAKPDVVLLQEIKVVDELFPGEDIESLGYNLAVHGQKTYNGVAILSKHPIENVQTGLPGDDRDQQARIPGHGLGRCRGPRPSRSRFGHHKFHSFSAGPFYPSLSRMVTLA